MNSQTHKEGETRKLEHIPTMIIQTNASQQNGTIPARPLFPDKGWLMPFWLNGANSQCSEDIFSIFNLRTFLS